MHAVALIFPNLGIGWESLVLRGHRVLGGALFQSEERKTMSSRRIADAKARLSIYIYAENLSSRYL